MSLSSRIPAFMGAEKSASAAGFHAAIFGAPHGTPYRGIDNTPYQSAPNAFRKAVATDADWIDHWDFDLGGQPLGPGLRLADLGNLPTTPRSGGRNRKRIEACTRAILDAGAVPIMFGGDDSVPIPFIEAFSGQPPSVILQVDAHIDWRHERHGETHGFSSTMRRASEQPHVWRIVQAGMRGIGSARQAEVQDALTWGARLITARDRKRCAAVEVMINTPYIQELVKKGDVTGIKEAIIASSENGVQSFDVALLELYKHNRIDLEEALNNVDSRANLEAKINFG